MSKKTKTPASSGRKRRKRHLDRASVALATVMAAGVVLAPTGANATLTTGRDEAPYTSVMTEGGETVLRDVLREQPKSEMAKAAFVQLAALCGGDSTAGRDGDCTVSVTSNSNSSPTKAGQGGNNQIYQ